MIIYWHLFAGVRGDGSTANQSVDTAYIDSRDNQCDISKATTEIPLFTAEEETKFTRRYEEGYDLNDPHYKTWLEIKHLSSVHNVETMVDHESLCDDTLGNAQPNDLALMSNGCLDTITFTVEQELKYACRYEEGYDLPDKHYEAWIRINHPQSPKAGSTEQMAPLPVSMLFVTVSQESERATSWFSR